jgi:hypothetical protein
MIMKAQIEDLKARFVASTTEVEREAIREELRRLCDADTPAVAAAALDSVRATNAAASEAILRERLKDILPFISVAHLTKTYFRKSPQWFYQRLNGNDVNGRRAHFTDDELKTLASALNDISARIHKSVAFVG